MSIFVSPDYMQKMQADSPAGPAYNTTERDPRENYTTYTGNTPTKAPRHSSVLGVKGTVSLCTFYIPLHALRKH